MAHSLADLVRYGGEKEAWQPTADLGMEELRVLHLDPKVAREKIVSQAAKKRVSKPSPTVTHILQQGHTS